jgi:hypothetical protein
MKNIQIIDEAINTAYAIYAVSEDEFAAIFPGDGQDIEFIEDLIERIGEEPAGELMRRIWKCPVDKRTVDGIHGTLFYGLLEKKKYYDNKREPVNDWRLVR